ncbi:hypothetical protein B0H13DRAFT_2300053 [Mycena leptocephala]|nr:hypothetical protein B0H13DRAFT_2300053 [Mycena leptocephala]
MVATVLATLKHLNKQQRRPCRISRDPRPAIASSQQPRSHTIEFATLVPRAFIVERTSPSRLIRASFWGQVQPVSSVGVAWDQAPRNNFWNRLEDRLAKIRSVPNGEKEYHGIKLYLGSKWLSGW